MAQCKLRVGQGIDVHPLVSGRPCILGGVTIPHDKGLDGHSDADALTHAVIDALLGAAGKGDIGTYFPPSDAKWKDADSIELLRAIWAGLTAEGWRIENLDCTVLAQAPKISPYIPAMKERIGSVLGLEPAAIGIKATTTEHLGFVGRAEGVMAQAVALLSQQV
jgi:2-C-methyl-D-erythritol 2,4-cyclodiphosphate synthase